AAPLAPRRDERVGADVGLEAAGAAAAAAGAVDRDLGVAPLAGGGRGAAEQLAGGDDAEPDAAAEEGHDGVLDVARRAEPALRHGERLGAVLGEDLQAVGADELVDGQGRPAEALGVQDLAVPLVGPARVLDDAGQAEAEADEPRLALRVARADGGDGGAQRRPDRRRVGRARGGVVELAVEAREGEVEQLDGDALLPDVGAEEERAVGPDAEPGDRAPALRRHEAALL